MLNDLLLFGFGYDGVTDIEWRYKGYRGIGTGQCDVIDPHATLHGSRNQINQKKDWQDYSQTPIPRLHLGSGMRAVAFG